MNNFSVKELKENELTMLCDLFSYNDVDDMINANKQKIENGTIDIFGLYENARLIGELRVMYRHEDKRFSLTGKRAYLYAFRIHEDFRGKGLSKYLLKSVISTLSEKGYTEFTIGVEDDNRIAKHIYSEIGFNRFIAHMEEEYQGDRYGYDLYMKEIAPTLRTDEIG